MTMKNSDKVKMTLNIGGEHIPLTVPFDQQDAIRDAEKAVSQIYNHWRLKWPSRSEKEVMAMVAFQFASNYQELLTIQEDGARIASLCKDRVSALLKAENDLME